MAKILLTGAFGTIGRWVLRELLKQGHSVAVFELDTARGRKVSREFPQVRAIWGDLRDAEAVKAAVAGHDYVLHMAFILTPATELDPQGAHAINIGGTTHVIAACRAQPVPPKLLFCSSVEVFGKNRHLPGPRRITDPVQETSVYTTQKIACEKLVRESGLDYAIVRFAAVIVSVLTRISLGMRHWPNRRRLTVSPAPTWQRTAASPPQTWSWHGSRCHR